MEFTEGDIIERGYKPQQFQSYTDYKLDHAIYFIALSFSSVPQTADCPPGNNWRCNLNLDKFSEALRSTGNYAKTKNLDKLSREDKRSWT